jgi:gamma-glutamylcyclotransferase (GGCT)/AIG2-like uncharacterized protein YtfP
MAFRYFGYGSNMALSSLAAKGVTPIASEPAALPGWRLRFNVQHFFRHEGGMANIEPAEAACEVQGVLHLCEDDHLPRLDAMEVYPHGYDRISVTVVTPSGTFEATTYVGTPAFRNDDCLPTTRYLNILASGAAAAGLDPHYVEALRRQPVLQKLALPAYRPPPGDYPAFTLAEVAGHPHYTALAGSVFDMTGARGHHQFLRRLLGGKDTTLFHLKRLDTSDETEKLDDVRAMRFNDTQKAYINEYLHAYTDEYEYIGRLCYDQIE